MADPNEYTDLEQFLKSAGWLRYEKAIRDHWQAQLSAHLALAAGDRDDQVAIAKIRQVIAAQKAIEMALAWPTERLQALKRQTEAQAVSLSRGGYDTTTPR